MFPDLPMNDEDLLLVPPERGVDLVTVSLLKQHTYCPRVVYYETCTPGIRPTTYKMEAGSDAHEQQRQRAARRSLFAYHLSEGERHFDVRLVSTQLQLTGIVDEVVLAEAEAVVVDYKLTEWVGDNHLVQIGAYGLLAEEAFGRPVTRGFVYLMKGRKFEEVAIDAALRNSVMEALESIHRIRVREYMPPPAAQKNKCVSCEFRRFCNDI